MEAEQRLAAEVGRAGTVDGAVRTLLLDLDGTLAPIVATPDLAEVPAGVLSSIERLLQRGWSVVVVSGRPAAQAARLVPVSGVRILGSHGLEEHRPVAGRDRPILDEALAARVERLASAGDRVAAGFPGAWVERKIAGLAFHDRQVEPERLAAWRDRLREWLDRQDLSGLEKLEGRRVLELRPRGVHKGVAVRRLAEEAGPDCRDHRSEPDPSFVAVGDDRTDEDMFRELMGRGLSIKVGPPGTPTSAGHRLDDPAAVARFLRALSRFDPAQDTADSAAS